MRVLKFESKFQSLLLLTQLTYSVSEVRQKEVSSEVNFPIYHY